MRYAAAWRSRRRRFVGFLASLLGWIPFWALPRIHDSEVVGPIILGLFAMHAFFAVSIALFKCPRCGRLFHQSKTNANNCNHCGLRAWEQT